MRISRSLIPVLLFIPCALACGSKPEPPTRFTLRFDTLATCQRHEILLRHRSDLTPQTIHLIAIDSRGAVDQARRVCQMLRPPLVHHHLDVRMVTHDRSSRTCVIEVNVGQKDVANIGPADTVRLQAELECRQAAGRTWIDDRHALMALDQCSRDYLRTVLELQIDP